MARDHLFCRRLGDDTDLVRLVGTTWTVIYPTGAHLDHGWPGQGC